MTATGNEAVTIAQAAKALDVDAQNSGATGDESVRLRQLKMLRDSLSEIESGPHGVIVTVYSNYAAFPSSGGPGIYFTDTNGQIQTSYIEEIGGQFSFSAMPGSMVLLASFEDIDAEVSGNAELAIDGRVELYFEGRRASLVFVYGECEIHC